MAHTDSELRKGKFCQHCGASVEIYQVKLTRGIAKMLIKFRRLEVQLGKRQIWVGHDDKGTEFELSLNDHRNMSRLRFLGLARYTESHSAKWFITRRGYAFLRGEAVPASQYIFRNRVVESLREDHITTDLKTVFRKHDMPFFEQLEDIRRVEASPAELKKAADAHQEQLLDVPARRRFMG